MKDARVGCRGDVIGRGIGEKWRNLKKNAVRISDKIIFSYYH